MKEAPTCGKGDNDFEKQTSGKADTKKKSLLWGGVNTSFTKDMISTLVCIILMYGSLSKYDCPQS